MKKFVFRFINGFCYAVAITMIVQLAIMLLSDNMGMIPEYVERFDNIIVAYVVQLLLIGFISGVASGGTGIMEWKRPGLVIQSVIYLLLMLSTWIPVACYLWGFHKYATSMVSGILSILVTYGICWGVQYKVCRRDVQEINERLRVKMLSTDM